jgi:ribonuclease VapC
MIVDTSALLVIAWDEPERGRFEDAIEAVSAAQVRIAEAAYLSFGKGMHPTGLNFGDCFAYASGEAILFKDDHFAHRVLVGA